MSASVNKVILLGNLGAKPELKYLPSGQAVCEMRIATTEKFGGKDGKEKQEKTEWHTVKAWGKVGENCAQYLDKGRSVYVEGRIETRSWDKDGAKHYKTEIVATSVQFLGGGKGEGGSKSSGSKPAGGDGDFPAPGDDDLPF